MKSDPVRDLVRVRMDALRLKPRQVSLLLKRNHAYIQQYLESGKPRTLPEGVRAGLAEILQVEERQLRESGSLPSFIGARPIARPAAHQGGQDQIPVLGMAQGGEDGWALWNGDVVAYEPRPLVLAGAPKGYAVYIVGHSMEPRYNPGEMAFINPGKPILVGHHVLIELHPLAGHAEPRAMVKKLVRRTPTKTVVEQFNPAKKFEIPNDEIRTIHRIVGSKEE